jgi:transcriptional regulator with XRE-family HTH domain
MWDRTPRGQRIEIDARISAEDEARLPFPVGSSRAPTSADGRVGRRIKEVRSKLGLTQKQVAARVGVTGAQFHRYEMGATRLATSRLIAIATALDIQPEHLMGDGSPGPFTPHSTPEIATSGDLVELVELYSSLTDPRRRAAMVAYARSLAAPAQPAYPLEEM